MAKLCSAPSVLSFGEPAWRSCPSADKPILGVERTGVAEPAHTLYLKLPLECDIDHTCPDSVGQGQLHGCGHHQWSRKVSLGNFGNRIYSRYLWEIIHFVIILVTNNSFLHTKYTCTQLYNNHIPLSCSWMLTSSHGWNTLTLSPKKSHPNISYVVLFRTFTI